MGNQDLKELLSPAFQPVGFLGIENWNLLQLFDLLQLFEEIQ